jgi:hypothetical protein
MRPNQKFIFSLYLGQTIQFKRPRSKRINQNI